MQTEEHSGEKDVLSTWQITLNSCLPHSVQKGGGFHVFTRRQNYMLRLIFQVQSYSITPYTFACIKIRFYVAFYSGCWIFSHRCRAGYYAEDKHAKPKHKAQRCKICNQTNPWKQALPSQEIHNNEFKPNCHGSFLLQREPAGEFTLIKWKEGRKETDTGPS